MFLRKNQGISAGKEKYLNNAYLTVRNFKKRELFVSLFYLYTADMNEGVENVPILELRNIVKKYRVGKEVVTALNGVDLSVEEGEFLAILGTSGCGKTTLLNVAAGLEKPTRGEVIFRGVALNKLKENQKVLFRRKHMGFIFQFNNLIPILTAQENVALPLLFDGVPARERLIRAVRDLIAWA